MALLVIARRCLRCLFRRGVAWIARRSVGVGPVARAVSVGGVGTWAHAHARHRLSLEPAGLRGVGQLALVQIDLAHGNLRPVVCWWLRTTRCWSGGYARRRAGRGAVRHGRSGLGVHAARPRGGLRSAADSCRRAARYRRASGANQSAAIHGYPANWDAIHAADMAELDRISIAAGERSSRGWSSGRRCRRRFRSSRRPSPSARSASRMSRRAISCWAWSIGSRRRAESSRPTTAPRCWTPRAARNFCMIKCTWFRSANSFPGGAICGSRRI